MKVIRQIAISPEAIDMDYMGETDVRAEGLVYQSHHVSIGVANADLEDELREFEEAATALLEAGLRQWAQSLPVDLAAARMFDPTDDLDEDDEDDEADVSRETSS